MPPELLLLITLAELDLPVEEGETAVDATIRYLRALDKLRRPFRHDQVDGMRSAYAAYMASRPVVGVDLNSFQAGYTLGVMK